MKIYIELRNTTHVVGNHVEGYSGKTELSRDKRSDTNWDKYAKKLQREYHAERCTIYEELPDGTVGEFLG